MREPLFCSTSSPLYIIGCLVVGMLANRLPIFGANADPRFVRGGGICVVMHMLRWIVFD
jgi:hypothetical protein